LLNEEGYIGPFLDRLEQLKGNFELLLVDGGSTDKTLEKVQHKISDFSHEVNLLMATRGRAAQMNEGALKAHGNVLLFLHVDCFIPIDSLRLIEEEILDELTVGGGFKQAFLGSDMFLKVVSLFGNLRSELTKTFFGDYGIFIRKDVFQEIGGYSNISFLEDVEICKKARKYGRLVRIDQYVFTSPRRYLNKGRIKVTIMFVLACLFNLVELRPRFLMKYIVNR